MNLDALIRDQNPQWFDALYRFPEGQWYHRPVFKEIVTWLEKDLIVTLTGLRRVGKSTLVKQALNVLLTKKHPEAAQNIFYFSFDGSVVRNESDTLRQILEIYATSYLNQPLNQINRKTYIFLDEVQLIPYWQDIIKSFYDLNPNLKFVVSGSAALFISKKSTESLAGRLKEIIIPPLSFEEYLVLNKSSQKEIEKVGVEKYASFYPEYLTAFFEKYLSIGQFPQPVTKKYSENETQEYIQTILDKIIEIDIPKSYPVKRTDILRIIFDYIKDSSGNLLSYENLTNDLGVDIRTTVKYIGWLKKAFLIDLCLNQTKKLVKASRTLKKVYLNSTNFARNLPTGNKVETYVFNFLKNLHRQTEFFRFHNQEIDFIVTTNKRTKIPVEVKYQEKINDQDLKNLVDFSKFNKSPYAFFITKNLTRPPKKYNKTLIYFIPAAQIELAKNAIMKRL